MGLSSIEENKTTCCLSPKIYQPASEDMDDLPECPRKKKMFSSSSFYEEPNAIYPTVEEQVRLCRKIAESLSDDCNMKSKGANMFFKRVKKAEKWIVAESSAKDEDNTPDSQKDPTKMPYVRPNKGLPKLKLILDPRHLVDMKRLLKEGVDIVEHNAVSPEICHDIVKDLNSPKGKGGQLFAKRKKKSEEWVVDEEKVRTLLHTRYPGYSSPEPPVEPLVHPRVKELSGVNSQDIAESVIRAAEAKIMTYPNAVPQVPVIECLERPDSSAGSQLQTPLLANQYQKPNPWSSDAYKCRLPKGWTSSTTSPALATALKTERRKINVLQNRILRAMVNAPWFVRNTIIYEDLNIKPIPEQILMEAHNFFEKMENSPINTLRELTNYDPTVESVVKRPRSIQHNVKCVFNSCPG